MYFSGVRFHRREALQAGVGLFGLTLPEILQAASNRRRHGPEVSCIFLFLAGGPSQFETFDPKPDAPVEIRGLWEPTSTSVPGTFVCEKLPLIALRMDKVALLRSYQAKFGLHPTAMQHMASGFEASPTGSQYFPNLGCLISALYGARISGIPAHFSLPKSHPFLSNAAGYLGSAHAPFDINGDPVNPVVEFGGSKLDPIHLENRLGLLRQLDNLVKVTEGMEAHDTFAEEAVSVMTSGAMHRAMNLAEEPVALRERYGMNIHGQRVLLARRMVEAGARFVTINHAVQGGAFGRTGEKALSSWDHHIHLFEQILSCASKPSTLPRGVDYSLYEGPGNLQQLDMSVSTLVDDLEERGMLENTLVVAMGEFGRTPNFNRNGGRDHYPTAGSVLLAGAGIQGGAVVGATDRKGIDVATIPHGPEDIAATIYHALGIDAHRTYFPRLPRPTPIASGQVIKELFG